MGKYNIMFVDDDALLLRSMKRMIEDEYDVTLATGVANAMFEMGRKRPDMIFLDYEMPQLDGKKAIELIKSQVECRDIPVVFLTAKREKEVLESVSSYDPAGFLLKPPVKEQILELIVKTLG